MQKIAELGVNILGGCCGTTPAHIRNLSEMIADHEPWEKLHVSEKDTENAVSRTRNNPFMEKLQQGKKVIAVELDPPFDQNAQKLLEGAFRLKKSNVDIITLGRFSAGKSQSRFCFAGSKGQLHGGYSGHATHCLP